MKDKGKRELTCANTERTNSTKTDKTMKDIIKNIRNSLDNTLAAVQDGLYSLKTLYFFKGQSGVREYIKDKVSLATALSRILGRNKRKD